MLVVVRVFPPLSYVMNPFSMALYNPALESSFVKLSTSRMQMPPSAMR